MTEQLELLRSARGERRPVTITVRECWYSCCSRGWRHFPGERRYTGRISSLTGDELLMISDGIGAISFALTASLADVLAVEPVEQKA